MISRGWIILAAAAVLAFFVFSAPIPQNQAFHHFSDDRTIFGVPNFWNVISNLPFLVVGVMGLRRFHGTTDRILFLGILLIGFGSACYHLAPTDASLVWDRLPMTVVFMSFLAAVIASDRVVLLLSFLSAGIGSVVWWAATNDLRPYGVVKFGPILLLAPILVRSEYRRHLIVVIGLFGLAQLLELADPSMLLRFALSGHTLKHLVAATATWEIYRWMLLCSGRSVAIIPEPAHA